MHCHRLALLAAATAWTVASSAEATGISVARMSGEHGHPTTSNATAIYFNPAGIALSDGTHAFLDVNLAWRHVTYDRPAAPTDVPVAAGYEGANVGKANLFNVLTSPMIGVTTKISDFALGAGFYTPFGGQSAWDGNSDFADDPQFPGPVDGVQRWYSIEGELRFSYVTLAAAYDTGPVQLGLSGNAIRSTVHTIRARTAPGDNNLGTEGRSLLDVQAWDFSLGAGIIIQPIEDRLWLGASYQSRPGLTGGMRLPGVLKNDFPRTQSEDRVDLLTDLPDIVRVGGRYRPSETAELRLFGSWHRWSVLERQCLVNRGEPCDLNADGSQNGTSVAQNQPRSWNDAYIVRAGASYWTSEAVELFAGAGFSSNAVPDATLEPALPDWHSVSLAVGGRFEVVDWIHLATSYTQILGISRDSAGKNRFATDFQPPSRGPDAGGEYAMQTGVFNVNADFAF